MSDGYCDDSGAGVLCGCCGGDSAMNGDAGKGDSWRPMDWTKWDIGMKRIDWRKKDGDSKRSEDEKTAEKAEE